MKEETITLYCRENGSDKVYKASIKKVGDLWTVPFQYGKRGAALTAGDKCSAPVEFAKAKKVYDKVVSEKLGKGYKPGDDAPTYVPPPTTVNLIAAPRPMLLTPIEADAADEYLDHSDWVMQEKYDGKRIILQFKDGVLTAFNRKGIPCGVPVDLDKALKAWGEDVTLDGELLGDKYVAFDTLFIHGNSMIDVPYSLRVKALAHMLDTDYAPIHVAPVFRGTEKKDRLAKFRKELAEGVVFKHLDAPYRVGRSEMALKFKFVATASCIVAKVNDKRSVALDILENRSKVGIGNVTIPANHDIPKAGDIVEVRYLYAYKGGSLFQPVYLGKRDDINADDCVISQLKYKQGEEETE